jgi:hypothetical protein
MSLFFRRGQAGAWWIPTIALPLNIAEITAGQELHTAFAGVTGFDTQLNRINTPVLKYRRELQLDGPETFGDATITFIEDDGTGSDQDSVDRNDISDVMVEGASGYIVFHPNKQTLVASDIVEIWPVKIGARNRTWSLDAEASRYVVQFAITGDPDKEAVVSA